MSALGGWTWFLFPSVPVVTEALVVAPGPGQGGVPEDSATGGG